MDVPPKLRARAYTHEDLVKHISKFCCSYNVNRGRIVKYHTGSVRGNPINEDTFDCQTSILTDYGALFGVFDGHAGTGASSFCRDELFRYLQEYRRRGITNTLLHKQTFVDADKHFLSLSFNDHRSADGLSGACVCIAHVYDNNITIANLGDCRAVLGRSVPLRKSTLALTTVNSVTSGYAATGTAAPAPPQMRHQTIALSQDHALDNPLERERLISSHAQELDIIKHARVKGRLQPTRGIGDGLYKEARYIEAVPRIKTQYALTGWNPPYTSARPTIVHHRLAPGNSRIHTSSSLIALSPQHTAVSIRFPF